MQTVDSPEKSGNIRVLGFSIFYKSFGESKRGTVLCLHGGPTSHDYMLPFSDLADFGYRIVFYDWLGCGKSETPTNKTLFTIEHYVEEVEGVRKALSLGKVHLLGSSTGGLLGIAYALKYQKNLRSLITFGATSNVPELYAEIRRLRKQLPREAQAEIQKYEEIGDYDNPGYGKACEAFYKRYLWRYLCRLPELPSEVSSLMMLSHAAFRTLWGPDEFNALGNLRYWNVDEQLTRLRLPVLVTCGRYDEITPKLTGNIHRRIKGSKFVIFEKSSHLAMWEERKRCMAVVRSFMDKIGERGHHR
jgi:proline iminopeptidase